MTTKQIPLTELSAFSEIDTNGDNNDEYDKNNEMTLAIKVLEDSHKAGIVFLNFF